MSLFGRLFGKPPSAPARPAVSQEFDALAETSRAHLAALTQAHQGTWRFGEHERWDVDQQEGVLRLTFADGVVAECPAQIVGSFDQNADSWLWAWDNPSVRDPMKRDARAVRDYGQIHEMPRLTMPGWSATKEQAWDMAAIATKQCEAQGAFCGPTGATLVFLTFGEVKLSKPPSGG